MAHSHGMANRLKRARWREEIAAKYPRWRREFECDLSAVAEELAQAGEAIKDMEFEPRCGDGPTAGQSRYMASWGGERGEP